MEDNLLIEGTWWKYKKTGETGFITDVQKKKGLIIFRFFQNGHVGSFTNMEFLREFEILTSHPDDIPVKIDSIWKSNKTGDIVKVLIESNDCNHCVHYINLNDTTRPLMMSHVDKAVFITEHTFLRDNDIGALYRHNKNPNKYLKVIETTEKVFMGSWMRFVKYRSIEGDSVEENDGCLIITFHSNCHLLSLDPEKEYTVPTDSVRTIKVEENKMDKIPYGSLWVDVETGEDTVKVSFIASENDDVFVHYVNIVTGIERVEKLEEFVTAYKLLKDNDLSAIYERRDNPSEWVQIVICNPDSTCVSYHHYGGEFNGREDENDITSFHNQYKLITFYPTDADIENMKFHGITKKFHKIAKELRDLAKECDITVGSIWREVRGCAKENVGRLVKVTAISDSGNIIDWVRLDVKPKDMGVLGVETHESTSKSSFLYCFERPCDHITAPSEVAWPGTIWYHTSYGGIHIAITIKEENGTVWFVSSDNKRLDLYWQMPFKEWVKTYQLYDGVVKPPCFPEGCFDEILKETEGRYERVMRRLKMEREEEYSAEEKETYLNTDKSKMKEFSSGAKREDKTGKGRYDLIPGDVMSELEDFAWESYFNNGSTTCSATDVSKSAYFDEWDNVELYYDFIVNVISYFFAVKHIECTDDCDDISYEVDWDIFRSGLYDMRKQLALHYEAGAVVHGIDNWKKGLPVYGGERGGCFLDSMRRHIDQALQGKDDEPHAVAALWNAFCAVWTLKNKPTNATNSSETKPEEDAKASKRSDMVDSLIHAASIYVDKAPDKIADAPTVSYSVLAANMSNCVELLSKMLVDNSSTNLKFETHEAYINLYMICVLLKRVLRWFHDNDRARVCIEHLISGIYDLINTNIPSVRRIFENTKADWVADWVEDYDEVYSVYLGNSDKYRMLRRMIDLCCRTGVKLMNDDHFCGRAISNGILFELKEHLSKLIKE